uniref:Uncharacterized protein n=1 Tax=Chrysotila carterae TaxID=13221 RepID=A0A7S4EUV3_CHRCT|eukprot:6181189-Pleurochrysis_carterae.AAC.5
MDAAYSAQLALLQLRKFHGRKNFLALKLTAPCFVHSRCNVGAVTVSLEVLPEGTSRTEKAAEEPERRDVGVEKLSDKIRMVASGSQDPGGTVAKASKRKTSKEASEQPTERQPRQKDRLLSPQQVQHKKKSRRDLASLKMGTEL